MTPSEDRPWLIERLKPATPSVGLLDLVDQMFTDSEWGIWETRPWWITLRRYIDRDHHELIKIYCPNGNFSSADRYVVITTAKTRRKADALAWAADVAERTDT